MILTSNKIQTAIIKAFYALAKKSVKYYTGLALGKNNTCLFKEIRLLRAYVDILRNFEIIGSTHACHCCIEGDYTFKLNNLSEYTNADIQFNCDNEGYLYYNNIGYPFTYVYDINNLTTTLIFDSPSFSSTLINFNFNTVNCNITYAVLNNNFNCNTTMIVTSAAMFGGSITQSFMLNGNIFYTHNGPFATYDELVLDFNTNNNAGYFMVWVSANTIVVSNPLGIAVGDMFSITYYGLYEDDESYFILGDLEFSNSNICTPTVVTETCLTNNQVLKIIQHINKLIK
jgi:hypothetical protein